ncbi:hypothetical protein AAH979_03055 [Plantactinospora sp. ZYX-F-223]|uniref:hypothetical protein n=1 Tax=Plantactinospora sp. ZYX-F-223 TaxID=3144103 RepID=UPI0031FCF953
MHLPATSADLAGAVDLAYALARSLGFLPQIEAGEGEATVRAEDAPHVRHRVCCDLPGGRRCALRAGHDGRCAEESPD